MRRTGDKEGTKVELRPIMSSQGIIWTAKETWAMSKLGSEGKVNFDLQIPAEE